MSDSVSINTDFGVMTDEGLITGELDIKTKDDGRTIIASYVGSEDEYVVDLEHYENRFAADNVDEFVAFIKSGGENPSGPRPAQ